VKGVRLRQAVVAVADLEAAVAELRAAFGLDDPFEDPGVGAFGLRNAVFAVGDTFLEAVSPIRKGTAAGRYLERRGGDCGYMVIFQLEDLEAARRRADRLGVRVVWRADMEDISGTHLHPADMRGAIVSLDRADPPGSWRWGGPDWIGKIGAGSPGRVVGITVSVTEPGRVAERWAEVLGVTADGTRLELDGSSVEFTSSPGDVDLGISEIRLELPDDLRQGRDSVDVAGVRFQLRDSASGRPGD
jgi:hypothetical protein